MPILGVIIALACKPEPIPAAVAGDGDEPAESEESEADEGDDGLLPKLDIFGATSADWFLHFPPQGGVDEFWFIQHLDVYTGKSSFVCYVLGTQGEPWPTSSTFTRDDRLMVSTGFDLWEVSLPDCIGTKITTYPEEVTFINGIAPDEGNGLLGISAANKELVRIDPDTGAVTPVGFFGFELSGSHGATWVEAEQELYLVEGTTDSLYRVDRDTGFANFVTAIDYDFEWVGFEHHPHTGDMYGCSFDAEVFRIDDDGSIELLTQLNEPCNNLAAPWDVPELPPIG